MSEAVDKNSKVRRKNGYKLQNSLDFTPDQKFHQLAGQLTRRFSNLLLQAPAGSPHDCSTLCDTHCGCWNEPKQDNLIQVLVTAYLLLNCSHRMRRIFRKQNCEANSRVCTETKIDKYCWIPLQECENMKMKAIGEWRKSMSFKKIIPITRQRKEPWTAEFVKAVTSPLITEPVIVIDWVMQDVLAIER